VALFMIHKTRSGAMVAINELVNINEWDVSIIIILLSVVVFVSIISYYTTIYLGDRVAGFLSKINYEKLCAVILFMLVLLVFSLTGFFGLGILLISIPIGMFASYAKIRKTHAMGVIMLPVIMYFI
jgi:putative membrane protein